jgi:hypothetical protein
METSGNGKARRWPIYIAVPLVLLVLLSAALFILFFRVHVVPPISVKLVDAITGKPVPGMNVCLQVESMTLGGPEPLRTTESSSGPSGRTFFWPAVYMNYFLTGWRGYWIRVTDPDVQLATTCGTYLSWIYIHPEEWPTDLGPDAGGRQKYFPVALLRGSGSDPDFILRGGRDAMQREMEFPVGLRIALIPVLKDVSDCEHIADGSLAEYCLQLNTYAAAMSLRDTDDEATWAHAEKLCDEVNDPLVSAHCKGAFRGATMLRRNRPCCVPNPNNPLLRLNLDSCFQGGPCYSLPAIKNQSQ